MQNDDLKKLLDDLDKDLSNKDEQQSSLSVAPKQDASQKTAASGSEFYKAHRKVILGAVAGLVVLFGAYQFGVSNSRQEGNMPIVKQTESRSNVANNTAGSDARVERAKAVQYRYYKPSEYLDDNLLYPQVYAKQGVHYYLDLSTAIVNKEITIQEGGKIYQFSVILITSDKITKSTKIMNANVYVGGNDALPAYLDNGQWKKLDYLGATAVGYNAALLLTDYFKL